MPILALLKKLFDKPSCIPEHFLCMLHAVVLGFISLYVALYGILAYVSNFLCICILKFQDISVFHYFSRLLPVDVIVRMGIWNFPA